MTIILKFQLKQVWASNLEEEFKEICKVVQDYQFVGKFCHFANLQIGLMETYSH